MPYIENILRIILQCKALLKALHVDISRQRTHSDPDDSDKEVRLFFPFRETTTIENKTRDIYACKKINMSLC